MEPARFREDLSLIPDRLGALAEALKGGSDGFERLDTLSASLRDRTGEAAAERSVAPFERVLVLGMGSSAFAAESVALEARASGFPVTVEVASTELLPAAAPSLLVIAISATGESPEVLTAIERYAGRAPLVAVTNNEGSSLASRADAVLPMLAGRELSGVACRTFRHTILVLQAVLERLGARFSKSTVAAAQDAAAASAHLLDSSREWLPAAASALYSADGTFVLAPADRRSSARQSALMMRELPRRPAFASETGDWSHVDVYLTKTLDYRALLYTGSRWDAQAIEWLEQRENRLVTVGGEHPMAEVAIRYPGDTDRMTAMLTEVLVGELLAWEWYQADPRFSWSRHPGAARSA
ncbi:SIS domain-containing protein [Ruicaihuangia caeni]|uniref:SIS domain-containing protein n=1 Tax=Ruicaihuangia caeni TaxID=3042517 RepID=UPI00338FDAD3